MTKQPSHRATTWKLKTRTLEFGRWPKIMGIVNVTPDSFSDGGKFFDTDRAVDHAMQLDRDGADILDVGGESTRPYSQAVSQQQELERIAPVIEKIVQRTQTPVSIDTSKAAIAQAAIEAGAEIINDVTGLEGDPDMMPLALETQAGLCVMHMQGNPQNMQDNPSYDNVTEDIYSYLQLRRDALIDAGIDSQKICLDPGIGFGKTHEHNFQLLKECERFVELGHPILVGHSRKGFVGNAIGDKERDRDFGTLSVSIKLASSAIHMLRVHNVAATSDGLKLWRKLND